MQKLDLRNNLNQLVDDLKSKEIVEFLDKQEVNKNELLRLIVESKSGYDKSITNKEKSKVIFEFNADKMYETKLFSSILSHISNATNKNRTAFLNFIQLNDFYSFQKTLIYTFELIDKLLIKNREIFDESNSFNPDIAEKNGNLILQIVEDDYIDLSVLDTVIHSIKKCK
ncbi:MAG: hypothetical protein JJE45_05415 [Prolixibacteraceae bacterium]|nr:hypothetical protein [Prolixibacteraceae bacterium]